jgi:hypothetical protein
MHKTETASPSYRHKEGAVYMHRREEKSSLFPESGACGGIIL